MGVFECDIAHRRCVAVLCMLYKFRCNPMHPLYGALSVPHVAVWVTLRALIEYRYTYSISCCRTSQYRTPIIHFSVPLWTILLTLYSMVLDWRVSRVGPMIVYGQKLPYSFLSSTIFTFLFFLSICWYCGLRSLD